MADTVRGQCVDGGRGVVRIPRAAALLALLVALLAGPVARGQVLQGAWVEESERAIDRLRKGNLRVIVVDGEGRPAGGARVHLRQVRHEFAWGVKAAPAWFGATAGGEVDAGGEGDDQPGEAKQAVDWDSPVWRCFSAVSLDGVGQWPRVQPTADVWQDDELERVMDWARDRGLSVRYGGVISSDVGRLPGWVAQLEGTALRDALLGHVSRVTRQFGGRVSSYDVLADVGRHSGLQDRLGEAVVRRLYQQAKASGTDARLFVRFQDALTGPPLVAMRQQVTRLNEARVPVDGLALEVRLRGQVLEPTLSRSMAWIEALGLPVAICDLQVGGSSEAGAAINLETTLRVLFAQRCVTSITFAGVQPGEVTDPSAALLGKEVSVTKSGEVVEGLVRGLWWTDEVVAADAVGNVRARVFAGRYEIVATLADGTELRTGCRVRGGDEKLVIMEPLKCESGPGEVTDVTSRNEANDGRQEDASDGAGDGAMHGAGGSGDGGLPDGGEAGANAAEDTE